MSQLRKIGSTGRREAETLLIGIGNSGRSDDGLGWAFVERVQQEVAFDGRVEQRYQLQVEDAALISEAERVIFVDSFHGELPGGFQLSRCEPCGEFEFTSHVLPPAAVLSLCGDLYGKTPRADMLMIQGSNWDLSMALSPAAERHLDAAVTFFRRYVQDMALQRAEPQATC